MVVNAVWWLGTQIVGNVIAFEAIPQQIPKFQDDHSGEETQDGIALCTYAV